MTALFMLCPTACGNAIWRRSTPWEVKLSADGQNAVRTQMTAFVGLPNPDGAKTDIFHIKKDMGEAATLSPFFVRQFRNWGQLF